MRFRALSAFLLASMLILQGACSNTSGLPTSPDPPVSHPSQDSAPGFTQTGHNLLGFWEILADSENGTCEVKPIRDADIHLNVLKFLEFGPCTNCLQITAFEVLPNKDLQIEVTFTHPFSQPNLSGFDVRGIAMFPGDLDFSEFGLVASSVNEGNTELINADGYTTLYNPGTLGNGLQGYLQGKMALPLPSGYATLNAYKSYFSDPNRRYFLAGDELSAEFLIRPPTSGMTAFGYAVDASWDVPSQPVTVPDSFPPTANSLEAYLIETEQLNPLADTVGATATLQIDVYDWQGESTLGMVEIESPYFWSGLIEAVPGTGGPGTKRFTALLVNEFAYIPPGTWPALIRVLDTSSQPGEIVDYTAWKMVYIEVINNHTPVCSADVSNLDPDPGEMVTFTDTSTDIDGPGDIDESWWDWENDGTFDEQGSVVTHSWPDPGVYYVNHMVTDMADDSDELDEPLAIDAGLLITLEEDSAVKEIDVSYRYQALDASYDSGGVIDVSDFDGPWDFTTIGLMVSQNWMRILADSDTEVAGFVDDFNVATTHFVKFENMFDPFFPILYQAEAHQFAANKLYIYGFHDPWVIGSSPFGPPDTVEFLAIPYPLTVNTDYSFDIIEAGFVLNYSATALGEGDVTVPYDGGTTYHCLLVRYRFTVSSADPVNGGTINFAFITDSGMVVANVIAVNDPPMYNWNTSSNLINPTGDALFQALHLIEL